MEIEELKAKLFDLLKEERIPPTSTDSSLDPLLDTKELSLLIQRIRLQAEDLLPVFWSKKERTELQFAVDFLEVRIQAMIRATLGNLDWYQKEGWKEFVDEGYTCPTE